MSIRFAMRCPSFCLLVVLIAIVLTAGCQRSTPTVSPPSQPDASTADTAAAKGTVTFEIVRGDEVASFDVDHVADGETLESVMRRIDQIPVTIHGSGITAFVDQIGDVGTSGTAGWTFQVDGEFATRGIGDTSLSPPTTIRWSFGSMPEN